MDFAKSAKDSQDFGSGKKSRVLKENQIFGQNIDFLNSVRKFWSIKSYVLRSYLVVLRKTQSVCSPWFRQTEGKARP